MQTAGTLFLDEIGDYGGSLFLSLVGPAGVFLHSVVGPPPAHITILVTPSAAGLYGDGKAHAALLELLERGAYRPNVTRVIPLEEVPGALRDVAERRSIRQAVARIDA